MLRYGTTGLASWRTEITQQNQGLIYGILYEKNMIEYIYLFDFFVCGKQQHKYLYYYYYYYHFIVFTMPGYLFYLKIESQSQ